MVALKALVIGMGVLIVAGTVTLVALLVQRAGSVGASGPFSVSLQEAEGARIGGIAATDRAVAVWVVRPDGERVIILDPASGRRAGEIRLRD